MESITTAELTTEMLDAVRPGEIFLTGEIVDSPLGMNMAGTGKQLRWVAVMGTVGDWAVYCQYSDKSPDWVKSHGDKVRDKENIRRVVSCDDAAFARYRH